MKIRRALISVSDKTGIVPLARSLAEAGIEILSTGGTARALRDAGLAVRGIEECTGFPEIMDGRVKTLHPHIHGALLGRRGIDDEVMAQHGIEAIDLLVVNLYPFRETLARPGCTRDEAIEQIDIGGPAMLRAAAKNHARVTVLVNPADYAPVLKEIAGGDVSEPTRQRLAAVAFSHTAEYDLAIATWMNRAQPDSAAGGFPERLRIDMAKKMDLRYGENPHQRAAFYVDPAGPAVSIARARILQGKALSYNNIADADAALECVMQFEEPACVIVKHANPCGVAIAEEIAAAYDRAFVTDPESAFGGIIALNRTLGADLAQVITQRQFAELIVAPEVEAEALAVLATKKNLRVLATGAWSGARAAETDYKRVCGGMLAQDRDLAQLDPSALAVVTQRKPDEQQMRDLLFAWKVARYVKSNAIVFCRDGATIGVGAGQMSRVNSTRIAAAKAQDQNLAVRGSVMASDAFFPFRDGLDTAAEHGIAAVIQPGGSVRDEEVIAAADEHGLAMVFTGMRHFRH